MKGLYRFIRDVDSLIALRLTCTCMQAQVSLRCAEREVIMW